MNSMDYEVSTQAQDVIRVSLSGNAANVRVMDNSNFQSYRSGRQHRYYGGHYRQSPVIIRPPSPGHWHVVVDLGGYPGHVNAAVDVIRRF